MNENNGSNLWWLEFWRERRNADHLANMYRTYCKVEGLTPVWSWAGE